MDILDIASKLARTTYTKEFCSVCGRAITIDEAKASSAAGATEADGDNQQPRGRHRDCSPKQTPEKTLTYQLNVQ